MYDKSCACNVYIVCLYALRGTHATTNYDTYTYTYYIIYVHLIRRPCGRLTANNYNNNNNSTPSKFIQRAYYVYV